MKKIGLHWQILISIALGVAFGLIFPSVSRTIEWLGTLFLRALRMVVLPLVATSILSGIVGMESGKSFGRLSLKVLLYYLSTSLLAIITGLILVNIFKPGVGADLGLPATSFSGQTGPANLKDNLLGIIPSNIFEALSKGDILPVIFFSILFGFFTTQIKAGQKAFLSNLFTASYEVMMKITLLIIRFAPLGIFSIVAVEMTKHPDRIGQLVGSLGGYMLVVILGLLIHGLITLPTLVYFAGRSKPFQHMKNMASALLTAFSTSSSSATLPLNIEETIHKSGVSTRIAGFTLPLGATINMDGTALYECVAALFIAQVYGIDLSLGQQLLIVLTALLASIGAAGIPMAGLVMLTLVLSSVHLPLEGIGLILAVDRILDMIRTTVNVWSDTCGAVVIANSEGENLKISRKR